MTLAAGAAVGWIVIAAWPVDDPGPDRIMRSVVRVREPEAAPAPPEEPAPTPERGSAATPTPVANAGADADHWTFAPAVTTDRWAPATPGRHPAVLLLHGAGGPGFFVERPEYARYPRDLATAGFVVAMPHYARARTEPVAALRAAVDWLAGEPNVDPNRIAVIGFSRGGFLGSCVAGTHPRIVAFASFYGGIERGCRARIERMPATLVLHGEADPMVPVEEAETLADFVRSKGGAVEVHTYPGQEHIFLGEALDDSARRLVEFLRRETSPR